MNVAVSFFSDFAISRYFEILVEKRYCMQLMLARLHVRLHFHGNGRDDFAMFGNFLTSGLYIGCKVLDQP